MTDRSIESPLDRKNRYTHIQTDRHTYMNTQVYRHKTQTHTFVGFCLCFLVCCSGLIKDVPHNEKHSEGWLDLKL